MSNIGGEVKTFMDDYSASEQNIKTAKREYALFEFFKWETIRDEIRKIDSEEANK